ncbi:MULTISPECIES: putative RNA methyltransferase [unclassified Pseudonocardia]|uniref:putative RNA methyltransferase n=1 Tax=unclassified Pseudonocardia TaxID=2619320 RepID=UPI000A7A6835|nr:hypothetical protein [Pseudonocardia sp. Ae707_Ps1]
MRNLACPAGHSFDIARQGYVSLLRGGRRRHRGDSTAMVARREHFLGQDHYRPLRSTLTSVAVELAPTEPRLVVDLAGGTGHYLSAVLDGLTQHWGLTTDLSPAALRRAARAHPRAAAIASDAWEELPLAPGTAAHVLNVFGPRNITEIDRVLADDGVLLIATAAPDHLHELRRLDGTLGVAPRKRERLQAALRAFEPVIRQPVTWRLALSRPEVANLLGMGPTGHHLDEREIEAQVARLPPLVGVTASIDVVGLRRRG